MEVPKIYPRSDEVVAKGIRSFDWEGDVLHTTDTLCMKLGNVTDREVLNHYQTDFTELREFLEAKRAGKELRPVVQGEWQFHMFTANSWGYECRVCHTTWDAPTNFCPNCGAKMRRAEA